MKEQKPFKVGATYKLKEKYINDFFWTREIENYFGKKAFEFTVSEVDSEGNSFYKPYIHTTVGNVEERHMFKRVDNK